jgi:acetyl esterase/lipase
MDATASKRKLMTSLLCLAPGLLFSGYVAVRRAGMAVLYKPVVLGPENIHRDICYREGSTDDKHRLDFYLPNTTDCPVLIFIHGGGLDSGDKALRVSGADVYGNIGRFYASHGIGVAVINYRLQPKVNWRDQVDDVAQATAWVYQEASKFGGDPERLFIGGHSAGAHLAARLALDERALAQVGLSPKIFRGVITVSGAAFDLRDAATYQLGAKLRHYEGRFREGDPTETWKSEASPITCARPGAPPFIVLYAEGDPAPLQRQSQLLHEALRKEQIPSELVVVPGQSHCRIVLTLSRPDRTSAPAILRFIERYADPSFTSRASKGTTLAGMAS